MRVNRTHRRSELAIGRASALGAVRMLNSCGSSLMCSSDGELSRYELVIIPECTKISPDCNKTPRPPEILRY